MAPSQHGLSGVDRIASPGRAAPADTKCPCRFGAAPTGIGHDTFLKGSFRAIEHMTRRRPLHDSDLPLRLKVAAEANGRFRYVILRNNGTVAQASSATFPTEAAARAAGGPVMRRRSLAARLTAANQQRA